MNKLKILLIFLVVFSILIRISNIILNKTAYSKIFKFIAGFLLLFTVIVSFSSFNYEFDLYKYPDKEFGVSSNADIKKQFEINIADIIENDIHNKFYVNCNVAVETNFEKLYVYIMSLKKEEEEEIKNYVMKNYCTPNDEVIIIHENRPNK